MATVALNYLFWTIYLFKNVVSNVKLALGMIPGNDLVGHGLEPFLHLLQHVLYVVGQLLKEVKVFMVY